MATESKSINRPKPVNRASRDEHRQRPTVAELEALGARAAAIDARALDDGNADALEALAALERDLDGAHERMSLPPDVDQRLTFAADLRAHLGLAAGLAPGEPSALWTGNQARLRVKGDLLAGLDRIDAWLASARAGLVEAALLKAQVDAINDVITVGRKPQANDRRNLVIAFVEFSDHPTFDSDLVFARAVDYARSLSPELGDLLSAHADVLRTAYSQFRGNDRKAAIIALTTLLAGGPSNKREAVRGYDSWLKSRGLVK